LPIAVGVCDPVCKELAGLKGVEPIKFPGKNQRDNRLAKTRAFSWTPFDRTLMLDADTIIQNKGIEAVFALLDDADFALMPHAGFTECQADKRLPNIYKETMVTCKATMPMDTWDGGIIAWKQNETTENAFGLWNEYWKKMGKARDLPSFCCAIQASGAKVSKMPKYLSDSEDYAAVVQHYYGKDFLKKFGLPSYRLVKQQTNKTDFRLTDWK
jgi:hypothetical protein